MKRSSTSFQQAQDELCRIENKLFKAERAQNFVLRYLSETLENEPIFNGRIDIFQNIGTKYMITQPRSQLVSNSVFFL